MTASKVAPQQRRRAVTGRLLRALAVPLVALGLLVAPGGTQDASAAAASWTLTGKGYGHGRGMGQWGAFGYATQHGWDHGRITDHFYGGTRLATDAGNPLVRVHLIAQGGSALHVTGAGLLVDGAPAGASAVRVRRTAQNAYAVDVADGCGGPWRALRTVSAPEVALSSTGGQGTRLCLAGSTPHYRGALVARETGTGMATVNTVRLDDYVSGVLPSEVPASWGSAPNGGAALRAQAVAARSYALSSTYARPWADTCDTTACQVYRGSDREDPRTTDAARATSGQVRRTSTGAVSRTEFSASTGGRTAGGAFPSVVDDGDQVASNPNRQWQVSLSPAGLGAAVGVGVATELRVDRRDGNGTWGGRVLQVTVRGSTGERQLTGDQLRAALGLRSTYLDVQAVSDSADRAYVQALYADVLGRGADPAGLASWSGALASGTPRSAVATSLVMSDEHVNTVVARLYRSALRRSPGGADQRGWVTRLRNGESLVQVYAMIYGSEESLRALGGGDLGTWVDALYREQLGRPADPSGLATWTAVARREGRVAAAAAVISSPEASGHRLAALYQQMLGRGPDPAGRASWLPEVRAGRELRLAISLAGSAEYWNRAQSRYAG